ncbi:MAG: hypothetical protein ACLFUG_10545 [Nitriliruptoraceae bacterium]
MAAWQVVLIAVVVLLPLLLLVGQHPARERLSTRGVPLGRAWRPTPPKPPVEDEHH